MVMLAATRFYPLLETIPMAIIPPSMRQMQDDHYKIAQKKMQRRMNSEKARDDFMSPVLETNSGMQIHRTYLVKLGDTL
jgi:hypothetical protein